MPSEYFGGFVGKKGDRKGNGKEIKSNAKRRIEGIKKTIIPSLIGIIFGTLLGIFLGDGENVSLIELFIIVAILTYLQKFIFPLVGVTPSEFEIKDWLYVGFMTLAFMLVSWTMYINA